jgi:amino acid transporter
VTGTPVNSVWLVVTFCACLNLIGLGSTQTITAIFNLCAPCLDLSYVAVICAHLWYSKRVNFIPGPFDLDTMLKPLKVSKVLNVTAITWVIFISIVLFCPTSKPVTVGNMNYAIVVAGFVAAFSIIWWFAVGGSTKALEHKTYPFQMWMRVCLGEAMRREIIPLSRERTAARETVPLMNS